MRKINTATVEAADDSLCEESNAQPQNPMNAETPAPELTPNPNPDPITGEPGSHPVATAAGAVAVCAAGAALGSIAGPLGTAIGGAAGAIAGGITGNVVGEKIDPTVKDESGAKVEDAYAKGKHPYGAYIPAYSAEYEGSRHYVEPTPEIPAVVPAPIRPATPIVDPAATTIQRPSKD